MKKTIFAFCFLFFAFCFTHSAHAGLVDSLNLAPLVPLVLDALMTVATSVYDFFVGDGGGIIYVLIWGWLAFWVVMYLVKMYFPKTWMDFFGISGGGAMWDAKTPRGFQIATDILKPLLRGVIAVTVLLQIRPVFVTDWLVDPFLRFGAIYTESLTSTITDAPSPLDIKCPTDVIESGWISEQSCDFLVRPVSNLANANNQMIKQGLGFLSQTTAPDGGNWFMYILTGLILIFTFLSSNFFMGLLVIQGIFEMGMALILYPFQVLTWVVKDDKSSAWMDMWPAFSGIIDALKKLIITMIACAFILIINISVLRALFIPDGDVTNFGEHSMVWMTSILTFFLMYKIFSITREYLNDYTKGMDKLYTGVKGDAKNALASAQGLVKKVTGAFKK